MSTARVVAADTITKLDAGAKGAVVVSGSHGAIYPAYLACAADALAVILNDAGGGKDAAGIGSLAYCDALGMAAATVSHRSARIGDTADMLERGVISHANACAIACGCVPNMPCADAAKALCRAPQRSARPPPQSEGRIDMTEPGARLRVVCLDSVSLVTAEDRGQIVVTGSHGGLVGDNPAMALRVDARAALYNDAGIGVDNAGIKRLPALDSRGIVAATVAAASARIGDGRSTLTEGVISQVNIAAADLGAEKGISALAFVALIQQAS